jgi:ribosome modulation factor
MKMNLTRWALAAALTIGLGGVALQADDAKDYSKTKQYQQGMREGKDDQAHHLDHSKKRHFKRDDDQKAYEAGYQKGFVVAVKVP